MQERQDCNMAVYDTLLELYLREKPGTARLVYGCSLLAVRCWLLAVSG